MSGGLEELTLPQPLVQIVRSVLAVQASRLVEPAAHRFLTEGSPGAIVESLRLLMTDIDCGGYREAFHGVVALLAQKEKLAAGRAEELYRAAYGAGYSAVCFRRYSM